VHKQFWYILLLKFGTVHHHRAGDSRTWGALGPATALLLMMLLSKLLLSKLLLSKLRAQ
jgi:hypothetical protein